MTRRRLSKAEARILEQCWKLGKTRAVPASTWSDTDERRGEIRRGAEKVLQALGAPAR